MLVPCFNRAKMEAIEDDIHLHREKSKAEAAYYHKVFLFLSFSLHVVDFAGFFVFRYKKLVPMRSSSPPSTCSCRVSPRIRRMQKSILEKKSRLLSSTPPCILRHSLSSSVKANAQQRISSSQTAWIFFIANWTNLFVHVTVLSHR